MFGKFLQNLVNIRILFVNFVDGNDNRYTGCFDVVDCFNCLRHDTVVGGHYEDGDVGRPVQPRQRDGEELMRSCFERALAAKVQALHFSLSSRLSGSHQNAQAALRLLPEADQGRIRVIDTLNVSAGSGLLLCRALRLLRSYRVLADLGVAKSHARPHVSNDNPYSEAHFKTLKYHPSYPERFGSVADARSWGRTFFHWYNHEHHHTGLALLTPADVHHGRAAAILAERQATLQRAYAAHPERFVKGAPQAPHLPPAVWINPPKEAPKATD